MIQDLDDIVGFGAFWGEVQTNIHKALGCLGTITNGSIRDIPQVAPGFQMLAGSIAPSHAFVHVVDFGGNVNIHGMAVKSGDLIHADRHGAVVVPLDTIDPMKERAEARRQGGADHRRGEIRQGRRGDQGRDEVSLVSARMPLRPDSRPRAPPGSRAASARRPSCRASAALRGRVA